MTIGDFPNLSNIAQIAPIPKKLLPNLLTIMDQYPYFQHSPKFLKNYFRADCTLLPPVIV